MKNQNFGIEIEMTGITRSTAAKVIAGYFHTEATHVGGCYDAYSVRDNDGRMWKIMRDASVRCENRSGQNASSLYSVEFVTPICNYDDIETIQERESTQAVVCIAILMRLRIPRKHFAIS